MGSMAKQNRVDPFGNLIATPARGTLMGNRGCLHNPGGQIRRHHQGQRWLICRLDFRDRRREVMKPGHYTELFFLDEATALAAGHRPCAECQRARFQLFSQLWGQANAERLNGARLSAPQLDAILHQERLTAKGDKVTYLAQLAHLPSGTLITLPEHATAYLVLEDKLLPWSPDGYGMSIDRRHGQLVHVLTPHSTVLTLLYGYPVSLHPSAFP